MAGMNEMYLSEEFRPEDAGRRLEDFYDKEVTDLPMTEILRTTLRVYGGLFLLLMAVFCFVRKRHPSAYNVLGSVEEFRTPLSAETFGSVSWMWKVFSISDEDMFEHCGMDAAAFIRSLRFGMKVACVGMFNSIYLIPTYATSGDRNGATDDRLERAGLGFVKSTSNSLLAATIAAYIVFGATMKLILMEFEWFTENRHRFLARPRPDNYTIYVANIPEEYQSDAELRRYFARVFSAEALLDVRVALDIPQLEKKVTEREAIVAKLEHAINIRNVKRETPRHTKNATLGCLGGMTVDSIPEYTEELLALNNAIAMDIETLMKKNARDEDNQSFRKDLENAQRHSQLYNAVQRLSLTMNPNKVKNDSDNPDSPRSENSGEDNALIRPLDPEFGAFKEDVENGEKSSLKPMETDKPQLGASMMPNALFGSALQSASGAVNVGMSFADTALTTLLGGEDGAARDAGFVSFADLKSKASALQMIHHAKPFTFSAVEAPLPKDVYWGNVGLSHRSKQVGNVLGQAFTVLLCVFWTIPVAFLSSLAEVSELKKLIPFLEHWVEKQPWIEQVLAQMKPLLVIVLKAILPMILLSFAKLEGHIAETTLQASLFTKLAMFFIVQIFFVQLISGSILSELQKMLDKPELIISLLGGTLPNQAGLFMQYAIVQTFLGLSIEALRISSVVVAWLRRKLGPNLTEKERNTPWMGLSPLSVPSEFAFAATQADQILFYVILFVYSVLAPISSFIMGFIFFVKAMIYRHQFIFIYPPTNDTGGQLWTRFIKLVIAAMFIGQITVFGVLSLKQGVIAAPLLVPLLIGTFMFNMYISQQHYLVTKHLPSTDCVAEDNKNTLNGLDFAFVKDQYLQPALQKKVLNPDNDSKFAAARENSMNYFTPTHSEVEPLDIDTDYFFDK